MEIQSDEIESEKIADSLLCCVCLDLLYKPVVLACGHASCFWCVHMSMSGYRESHCPLCRHPYCHFPTICQMLHALLLKMYPITYKMREKQTLEEEKKMGFFSPNLDEFRASQDKPCNTNVHTLYSVTNNEADLPADSYKTDTCIQHNTCGASSTAVEHQTSLKDISHKILIADVSCATCKQLLFRPVVLNCGHVYCESCLPVDGSLKCQICQSLHPNEFPKVYLDLDHLLEERFTEKYKARKITAQPKQVHIEDKNQSNGSTKVVKNGIQFPAVSDKEFSQWCSNNSSNVHFGVGCDYCGMIPIIGKRYKCKDCKEKMGFDLCEDCYNTHSKLPGRFNQQHTSDHRFVIEKSYGLYNVILNLMSRQSDSGTPSQLIVSENGENILPHFAELTRESIEHAENIIFPSAETTENAENVDTNPSTSGTTEDQDGDTSSPV